MEIYVTRENQCAIVTVKGRVDSYTAPEFSDSLHRVTLWDINTIILDLENVVYISSAGLRVLIDIHKICKKLNKAGLVITNIPPRVYETLELAGFAPLFRFFADVQTALEQC